MNHTGVTCGGIAGTNAREWKRIRESVLRCFYERDGRYYHKRLDLERQKQTEFRGKKVSAGSSGASKRWHSHASANGKAIADDSSSSASASATAVQTPPVSVARPPPTKPLGYKPRIDVAWPGRPPVPGALHAEFVSKLGGSEQEASKRLRAWYPVAAAPYDDQSIGDDDWKFWRARFREWQGTTVKPIQPAEPRETDEQNPRQDPRVGCAQGEAMTDAEFQPFRASLERTAASYGKPLAADLCAVYFKDLQTFPLPAVLGAIDKARQSGKFFPRVSTLRELCQSHSAVAITTDVPSWVKHDEAVYFCQECDDTGFVRRLECAGDGTCRIGGCGRQGHQNNPHGYTRMCACRGGNPILRRQRELIAARTVRSDT